MSTRYTSKARRRMAAVAIAAGLALAVAGCSSDDPKPESSSSAEPTSGQQNGGSQKDPEQAQEVLAKLKGANGVVLTINSAVRDSGGFVTVNGQLENASGESVRTSVWRGDESEVLKHGSSLAGATLVDSQSKKRYFVLRDTEGRPLTTTFDGTRMDAGEKLPVFMQFPAPPASTTAVNFQLATFPATDLEISE